MTILRALIKKETLQIKRDPSALLIAFILPLILLIIFGYGINLDNNKVNVGLVIENTSPDINSLAKALTDSTYLNVLKIAQDKRAIEKSLIKEGARGIIIIPQDFSIKSALKSESAPIQVIADGSEPNVASFLHNYVAGIIQIWLLHQAEDNGIVVPDSLISVEPRFWYNEELKSRNFLVPGSIAIIITLIGTLLTALVIAREWERGTMEAILATPVTITQIVLGKLIPYFILGMCSMIVCWIIATLWYDVPFRGSFLLLILSTSAFLVSALGLGFLISSVSKDQFLASQLALMSAFLPSYMLSGFIFEISSMPEIIRAITYCIPARYFITILQCLFLVGNIGKLILYNALSILFIGAIFFSITLFKTSKKLDT